MALLLLKLINVENKINRKLTIAYLEKTKKLPTPIQLNLIQLEGLAGGSTYPCPDCPEIQKET